MTLQKVSVWACGPLWVPFPPLDKTPWPAGLGHIPPLGGGEGELASSQTYCILSKGIREAIHATNRQPGWHTAPFSTWSDYENSTTSITETLIRKWNQTLPEMSGESTVFPGADGGRRLFHEDENK